MSVCAAARAGIVRPRPVEWQVVGDRGKQEQLMARPAYPFAQGFAGDARLARLLQCALTDLWRDAKVEPESLRNERIGLYLGLPSSGRAQTGESLVAKQERREVWQKRKAAPPPDPASENARGQKILGMASTCADVDLNWSHNEFSALGHTSVAPLLRQACEHLHADQIDFAVVGGVDSLLDEGTLAWLDDTGRLKTPKNPVGLCPGEAASLLLLQHAEQTGLGEKARVLGSITAVAIDLDPTSHVEAGQPQGHGLSQVMTALAPQARWSDASGAWVFVDQNGETFRAQDWGCALARALPKVRSLANAKVSYTAATFGDVGAASAALGVCLCLAAFDRGYASADVACILSAADGHDRSGFLIGRKQ